MKVIQKVKTVCAKCSHSSTLQHIVQSWP